MIPAPCNQYFLVGIGMVSRKDALKLIYRHTHPDFKSHGNILVLRRGGTHSVPIGMLTDEEVTAKLPYAVKKETERRIAAMRIPPTVPCPMCLGRVQAVTCRSCNGCGRVPLHTGEPA